MSESELVTVVIDRADLPDFLRELRNQPGIDIKVVEVPVVAPDASREHPQYSLDYSSLVQLSINVLSAVSSVATVYQCVATIFEKVKQKKPEGRELREPKVIYPGTNEPITVGRTVEASVHRSETTEEPPDQPEKS